MVLGVRRSLLVVACVLAAASKAELLPETQPLPLQVGDGERLLVVSPHPDDETLAAGGLAQRVLEHAGSVRTVILTAGDGYVEAVEAETGDLRPRPREFLRYGEERIREAHAVARLLGGGRIRLDVLGFPDGGLEPLLHAHWTRRHPERSPTTEETAPPYPQVLDRHVGYDGADLRAELVRILRETRPTLVALSDDLDLHPDHRASGLFALLALDDSRRLPPPRGGERPAFPRVLAYLVHWPHWPLGWQTEGGPEDVARLGLDLPPELPLRGETRTCLALTPDEIATKRRALSAYHTQQAAMGSFLAAFSRSTECFSVLTEREVDSVEARIERGRRAAAARARAHGSPAPRSPGR